MSPPALALLRLRLSDFRSYTSCVWQPGAAIMVVTGPNGSGKTNLLEAISLLMPGRGLRGARQAELARQGGPGGWALAARLATPQGMLELGTGIGPAAGSAVAPDSNAESESDPGADSRPSRPERRVFRLDGATPRSLAEVADRVAAVWLTPQMERLFQGGAGARRRFLDRLVWALEPAHAREVAAHETAMAGRNRLLAEGRADPAWLAGLEDAMARHAVAATAARLGLVARLNQAMAGGVAGAFPAVRLALLCPIAERLATMPALAVESWLRTALESRRADDARARGAGLGAHRADLAIADLASGVMADLASTGQQKAMLVGVVLAHAGVIAALRGFAPLLLLDEPVVHLDAPRRAALYDALAGLPAQCVITGTDTEPFAPLRGLAEFWVAGAGEVRPDPLVPPVARDR